MNPTDYPADTVIAFRKALYYSDCEAMRRFRKEEPDLFPKLLQGHFWVVCDAARQASTSPEAMRVLLELGAPTNQQDSNGFTGLCWAVTFGRHDVAKVLLECGADPNLNCPLFLVANTKTEHDRIAMAMLLLDHGADINQPFLVEGLPPRNVLSEAVTKRYTKLVEFLESRGAKLTSTPRRKR